MPSPAELERVRLILAKLSASASGDLRRLLGATDQLAMSQVLADGWVALIEKYGGMASEIGAEQFDQWASELGIRPRPVVAPAVDERRATARLGWALTTPDALGNLLVLADELVKQPFRSTLQDSALKSGAGWARVPSSHEPCAFCLLLASRGGVYSSKGSASLGGNGKKYHGDCHCVPTLVRGPEDYPQGYDPNALYDAYSVARGAADSTSTGDILSELRRQQGTN